MVRYKQENLLQELEETLLTIRAEIEEHYPKLRKTIAQWFAYAILYKPKYKVTHGFDPSWDSSGIAMSTGKSFCLSDYDSIEDFLSSEYTGQSQASFVSGCGLFHQTYKEALSEVIRDWLTEELKEIFSNQNNRLRLCSLAGLDDVTVNSERDFFDFICQVDEALDQLKPEPLTNLQLELELELNEKLEDKLFLEDVQTLFNEGEKEAIEQYEKEQELVQEAHQKRLIEKFKAETILEKMYKFLESKDSSYKRKMTISKQSPIWKITKLWLKTLAEEELPLVLQYGNFSNSIREGKF